MKTCLNLGCGITFEKAKGYEMHYCDWMDRDIENFTKHNCNYYPYPFEDNSFDLIICYNCFEHLTLYDKDRELWIDFFKEISRILKPNGVIKMLFPHFSGTDCHQHHTKFSAVTLISNFKDDGWWKEAFKINLKIRKCFIVFPKLCKPLGKLINRYRKVMEFWEIYLCYIIRGKDIYLELEKVEGGNK